MRLSSLFKAASIFAAVGLLCSVTTADAQIQIKEQQDCINTINKDTGKVLKTQGKEAGKCQKDFANNKLIDPVKAPFGNSADACILFDRKGKVLKTTDKTIENATTKKCIGLQPDFGPNVATAAAANVAGKENALVLMQNLFGASISGGTVSKGADKDGAKCQQGVLKSVQKCVDTKVKEFGKCKKTYLKSEVIVDTATLEDCLDNAGLVGSVANDEKGKIAKACAGVVGKGIDGTVAKKCTAKVMPNGTITSVDGLFAGISGSVTPAVLDAAAECAACRFLNTVDGLSVDCDLFDNGAADGSCPDISVCAFPPSGADLTITAGQGGGNTGLSTGWTGFGHNTDISDGFVGNVDFNCPLGGCNACEVKVGSAYTGNRCSNDHRASCSDPFVTGGDCGGGATCLPTFGGPLPLNAAATPVCVVNGIIKELDGSVNMNTGESSTLVTTRAVVYTGTQSRPCPTCDGDGTPNDGVRGGTCTGGADNGTTCDAHATSTSFGSTSYDCRPSGAANVSGLGLDIGLRLGSGTASLTAGGVSAVCTNGDCHCGVCSINTGTPCSVDSDCPDKKETCSSSGTGVDPSGNDCSSDLFVCTDDGSGDQGLCASSFETFCDGQTDPTGKFTINCGAQIDCDTLDTECSGGDCGLCAAVQQRPCFLDTIPVTGSATPPAPDGSGDPDLGSVFCVPPTSSAGVNGAAGLPGPGRVTLDFGTQLLCSDGTTAFDWPDGLNCP